MSIVNCPAKIIKLNRPKGEFSMQPSQPPMPASNVSPEISTNVLMHGGNAPIQPDLNEPHPDPTMAAAGVKRFVKVDGSSLLSSQDLQMMNNQLVNSIDHKCKVYTSSLVPAIAGSGGGIRRYVNKSYRKKQRKSYRKKQRKSFRKKQRKSYRKKQRKSRRRNRRKNKR